MTATSPSSPAAMAPGSDWARPLLERQVAVLGMLIESGLRVTLALEKQVLDLAAAEAVPVEDAGPGAEAAGEGGNDAPLPEPSPALKERRLAYGRAQRGVRLSIFLQERLIRSMLADDARAAAGLAALPPDSPEVAARKTTAMAVMKRIVEREHRGTSGERMARERLERDFCGDILSRPISETVAMLCKDLKMSPPWAQLAEEAWALEEMASGEVGWPLAPFAAHPGECRDPGRMAMNSNQPDSS